MFANLFNATPAGSAEATNPSPNVKELNLRDLSMGSITTGIGEDNSSSTELLKDYRKEPDGGYSPRWEEKNPFSGFNPGNFFGISSGNDLSNDAKAPPNTSPDLKYGTTSIGIVSGRPNTAPDLKQYGAPNDSTTGSGTKNDKPPMSGGILEGGLFGIFSPRNNDNNFDVASEASNVPPLLKHNRNEYDDVYNTNNTGDKNTGMDYYNMAMDYSTGTGRTLEQQLNDYERHQFENPREEIKNVENLFGIDDAQNTDAQAEDVQQVLTKPAGPPEYLEIDDVCLPVEMVKGGVGFGIKTAQSFMTTDFHMRAVYNYRRAILQNPDWEMNRGKTTEASVSESNGSASLKTGGRRKSSSQTPFKVNYILKSGEVCDISGNYKQILSAFDAPIQTSSVGFAVDHTLSCFGFLVRSMCEPCQNPTTSEMNQSIGMADNGIDGNPETTPESGLRRNNLKSPPPEIGRLVYAWNPNYEVSSAMQLYISKRYLTTHLMPISGVTESSLQAVRDQVEGPLESATTTTPVASVEQEAETPPEHKRHPVEEKEASRRGSTYPSTVPQGERRGSTSPSGERGSLQRGSNPTLQKSAVSPASSEKANIFPSGMCPADRARVDGETEILSFTVKDDDISILKRRQQPEIVKDEENRRRKWNVNFATDSDETNPDFFPVCRDLDSLQCLMDQNVEKFAPGCTFSSEYGTTMRMNTDSITIRCWYPKRILNSFCKVESNEEVSHTKMKELLATALRNQGFNQRSRSPKAILAIPGGGHFLRTANGDLFDAKMRLLCNEMGCPVFSFQYRTAPEVDIATEVDDCLRVYRYLVGNAASGWFSAFGSRGNDGLEITPDSLVLYGESCGGSLIISMLSNLVIENEYNMLPNRIVLESPWVNPSATTENSNSMLINDSRDSLFSREFEYVSNLVKGCRQYITDPVVSPLHLPEGVVKSILKKKEVKFWISTGENEIFRDQIVDMCEKMGRVGGRDQVQLNVYSAEQHTFVNPYDEEQPTHTKWLESVKEFCLK